MLVDGGVNSSAAWAALASGIESIGGWRSLELHFVTHMHRDHIGLVSRVRDASSVPLAIGVLDAERGAHAAAEPEEEAAYRDELLRRSRAPMDIRRAVREGAGRGGSGFPPVEHPLPSGETPLPAAPEWLAIWTPGHTAGHTSLFRHRDGCLIAGDAVLPTITPTIGVNRQREDPVADYLDALARLRLLEPAVVLPGHGEPMRGITRVEALRAEVVRESERVFGLVVRKPESAWEIATRRYAGRDLPLTQKMQAFRETLAHLEHLAHHGRVVRYEDEEDVITFGLP